MAVDKDYLYSALLKHNYLPMVKEHRDETPPLFTTTRFEPDVGDALVDCYANFGPRHRRRTKGFDQIEYRTTRFNNVARQMHIPHPMPYACLCQQLRNSWHEDSLNRICENTNSKIRPETHDDGRIFVSDEYEDRPAGRVVIMGRDGGADESIALLSESFGKFYYVEADISSCFYTIYSHAIPWALVGHAFSKENRGPDHWFNQLDKQYRLAKRGETLGVPVGPATSNIACELVLYPIDETLRTKGYIFTRHIDDYRCYCDTREAAEKFIRDLDHELSKSLLSLNAKKILIAPLPRPLVSPWVIEMRNRAHGGTPSGRQVLEYLDYAVSLNQAEPDGSVIKYALRVLSNKLSVENSDAFFAYALNLSLHSPVALPILCDATLRFGAEFRPEHLSRLLRRHLEHKRSDAVCWTLYLHGLAGVPVTEEDAELIVSSKDCMCMAALLALGQHIPMLRRFVRGLPSNDDYRFDQYWILLHELSMIDELPLRRLERYCEETGLGILNFNQVSFLRPVEAVRATQDPIPENHVEDDDVPF